MSQQNYEVNLSTLPIIKEKRKDGFRHATTKQHKGAKSLEDLHWSGWLVILRNNNKKKKEKKYGEVRIKTVKSQRI